MTEYALASLSKIKRPRILGPTKASERISVFSFVVENGKPLDVAALLDRLGVAVRAGDLASLPALVHGIQLVITRNYIENLRDEVRKGMREKAAQGIYPSRPPLGYRNNKLLRTIEVDPDNAPIARRIFELYATGMYSLASLRQFFKAEYGKVFTKWHLEKLLKNPFYVGTYEWEGKSYAGTHPPLVSLRYSRACATC